MSLATGPHVSLTSGAGAAVALFGAWQVRYTEHPYGPILSYAGVTWAKMRGNGGKEVRAVRDVRVAGGDGMAERESGDCRGYCRW